MPDFIIRGNDTIKTYNLLVEQYLQDHEIVKSDKLFGLSFREGASFNCWRGYQAIYKIERDSLCLVDITNCGERWTGKIDTAASEKKMKAIFGDKLVNGKVFIDWFSGAISFPLTNKILRWDGVFYTIYENERVFSIVKGKILNVKDVNNYEDDPDAIDRRYNSKISDVLFRQLKKVKWENIKKFDCSDRYLVTIGKNGRVSKVIMPRYPIQDSIDKYWDKDEYQYCINNVFKALQNLKFDIIKDKGIPIPENVYIEIWFISRKKIEKLD
jgi:hypothetical protein